MPRIDIPPSVECIATVRHALADDLAGVGTRETVADATLVLSEILSNAVRHSNPAPGEGLVVDWHVEAADAMVVIAVTDGTSDADLVLRPPSAEADSGRGLAIVDTIAAAWGVRRSPHHKTVWARVPLTRNG